MTVLLVQGDVIAECEVVEIRDSFITISNLSFHYKTFFKNEDKDIIRNKIYLSV